ncbi:MAG: hypothetical protein LBP63_01840 [Prevotellaceae bacterium]|nr:hypothetical protein [Prevotellaceae bacterium]
MRQTHLNKDEYKMTMEIFNEKQKKSLANFFICYLIDDYEKAFPTMFGYVDIDSTWMMHFDKLQKLFSKSELDLDEFDVREIQYMDSNTSLNIIKNFNTEQKNVLNKIIKTKSISLLAGSLDPKFSNMLAELVHLINYLRSFNEK